MIRNWDRAIVSNSRFPLDHRNYSFTQKFLEKRTTERKSVVEAQVNAESEETTVDKKQATLQPNVEVSLLIL